VPEDGAWAWINHDHKKLVEATCTNQHVIKRPSAPDTS